MDFKETERKLLTLPVREKIPVWKYAGFSRKVRKFNREKYGPKGRKSYAKRYVVALGQDNNRGLKAVFKPGKRPRYEEEVRAYRFARFMGFDFVPPAVVRTIDGEAGALKLFVEGELVRYALPPPPAKKSSALSFYDRFFRRSFKDASGLSEKQKSDIFTFYFIAGATDIKNEAVVSKKCGIALIDNDEGRLAFHPFVGAWQWVPFPDLDRPAEPINAVADFSAFPLKKARSVPVKALLSNRFAPGMRPDDYRSFKKFAAAAVSWGEILADGKIHFVRWKGGWWIKLSFQSLGAVYKNPPRAFSKAALAKLKLLNENILRDDLLLGEDKSAIMAWLYRKELLLKAAESAKIIP